MNLVVLFSGGLDSTTLLYHLLAEGHQVRALSVHYGQRHACELLAAERIATACGVEQRRLDLSELRQLFSKGALTSACDIPRSAYDETSLQQTTVPNRNMVLLSLALAWASSVRADGAAFAAHTSRQGVTYPDCRPAFASALDRVAQLADWRELRVVAPFVTWSKADIVRRGAALEVPFEQTWSCYVGEARHCGRCGTCRDRQEAFQDAGILDPTNYVEDERSRLLADP